MSATEAQRQFVRGTQVGGLKLNESEEQRGVSDRQVDMFALGDGACLVCGERVRAAKSRWCRFHFLRYTASGDGRRISALLLSGLPHAARSKLKAWVARERVVYQVIRRVDAEAWIAQRRAYQRFEAELFELRKSAQLELGLKL